MYTENYEDKISIHRHSIILLPSPSLNHSVFQSPKNPHSPMTNENNHRHLNCHRCLAFAPFPQSSRARLSPDIHKIRTIACSSAALAAPALEILIERAASSTPSLNGTRRSGCATRTSIYIYIYIYICTERGLRATRARIIQFPGKSRDKWRTAVAPWLEYARSGRVGGIINAAESGWIVGAAATVVYSHAGGIKSR